MPARSASLPAILRVAVLVGSVTASTASMAAPVARECVTAHADGQVFRDGGQLLAARQEFLTCAAEACPALVRKECSQLGADVLVSIPTLVLAAVDEQGRDLRDVRVLLDGRSVASKLDGIAVPVDPGEHQLRFELSDGTVREVEIVAREAEKRRRVVVKFERARPLPASAEPAAGTPASVFVFGGVGAAALGSFAYFSLSARSLEDCAPSCADAEVDRIRARYLWADVSLAVSAVSFAAMVYLLLSGPSTTSGTKLRALPSVALAPELSLRRVGLSAEARF